MKFPTEMMFDSVWVDRLSYSQAEEHALNPNPKENSSDLLDQISSMREKVKSSLSGCSSSNVVPDNSYIKKLEEENKSMKRTIEDLVEKVNKLSVRVEKLEESKSEKATTPQGKKEEQKNKDDDDDDDDFDIFGDSDVEEEETEEEKKKKEELLKKYHEKKSKKPAIIAKSSITLDVKPWDDETDMVAMEKMVKSIEMDGLVWGSSKLVPLAYGIKKLQIICVVEDEKVGSDDLSEEIQKFEDYVQSVDIAAFNKI